ncbi:MAG: hypothetical protein P8X79_05580 [Reinekea sp.]
MGDAIESSNGDGVHVNSTPNYSASHSSVFVESTIHSDNSSYMGDEWNFAQSRILLNFRGALNRDNAPYKAGHGLEVAFVGGDSEQQIRASIHFTNVDFNGPEFDAYNNPVLAGFDLDYHRLFSTNDLSYFAGIRFGGGIFGYGLNAPVNINFEEYNNDTLGYFGLGLPVGMQMELGSLALEAMIVPTVHLFSEFTDIGFFNDILQANTLIPISFGLGYAW